MEIMGNRPRDTSLCPSASLTTWPKDWNAAASKADLDCCFISFAPGGFNG